MHQVSLGAVYAAAMQRHGEAQHCSSMTLRAVCMVSAAARPALMSACVAGRGMSGIAAVLLFPLVLLCGCMSLENSKLPSS